MKYPFDSRYRPALPVVPVVFHNTEEGLRSEPGIALLDTGSDGSLVPIAYLQQILAPILTDIRICSHWGEWRSAQLFLVDLEVDGLVLPGIFVVGDEMSDEIVLGRNVLNSLRLLLDGPANLTEVLS